MYEQHFGLQVKPFSLSPDPKFLFFSKRHAQAYAMLEYAVAEQVGFTLITGEVGSGKTTLLRKLVDQIDDKANIAVLAHTHQGMTQIVPSILDAFGAPLESLPEQDALYYRLFTDFLTSQYSKGRRSVLVIDEAQNLSVSALEQLRLLSNINVDGHLMLQTILIGQPELRTTLKKPELQQFAQRISVDFFLPRLSMDESVRYIDHRIKAAGGRHDLFDEEAKKVLAFISHGLPRMINNLSDMSLVYAFSEQSPAVTRSTVLEVYKDKRRGGILPMRMVPPSGAAAPKPLERASG